MSDISHGTQCRYDTWNRIVRWPDAQVHSTIIWHWFDRQTVMLNLLVWWVVDSMAYACCHVDDDSNHRYSHNRRCPISLPSNSMGMESILKLHSNGMFLQGKLYGMMRKRIETHEVISVKLIEQQQQQQ